VRLEAGDGEDTEIPSWSCVVEIARDLLNEAEGAER
jgi:hypothetical protein